MIISTVDILISKDFYKSTKFVEVISAQEDDLEFTFMWGKFYVCISRLMKHRKSQFRREEHGKTIDNTIKKPH